MKVKYVLFSLIFLSNHALSTQAASVPSLSAISQLAIGVVEEKIDVAEHARVNITPQSLDTRLKPPLCFPPITAELASNRAIKRNNTVKITCKSPQLQYPWQIFISVRVDILYPVVVARATLGPGDLIAKDDIVIKYVEQTLLRGQQFSDLNEVVGTRVKRRMAPDQPIFSNNLCFVCKGDSVSIYARTENFEIKTVGEALQDGNLGDRIRIKNTYSNKRVDARVIDVGKVEVRM